MSKLKTDWERLKNMTEEEIQKNALEDPDAQPTTKEMWNNARVVMPSAEPKEQIAIRVSPYVLDFFKKQGKGYQSRMNAVLEAYVTEELARKQK